MVQRESSPVDTVAAFIRRHAMLQPAPCRVGVAVSGGADSVVLLHLLQQLRSDFGAELEILHVNHQLRGSESDADEAFVRNLAARFGLPITVERAAAPETQIERRARELRRAFFERARRQRGLNAIALGHNRSDQAETVLFRLLRGSGLTGLAGMRPVTRDAFIRPLLPLNREEIRQYAQRLHLEWREDHSNYDLGFTRNQLRLHTIPALSKEYNPRLEALLAQSAELAQTEEDYWATEIAALGERLMEKTRLGWQIAVQELAVLHLALRRRLIREAVRCVREGNLNAVEFGHIEAILEICRSMAGHDRVMIPGVDALRSFDQLLLSPPELRKGQERDFEVALEVGKTCELPYGAGFLTITQVKSGDAREIYANFKEDELKKVEICCWDSDFLAPKGTLPFLCVRNWRPGDVFQPVGHHSPERIKTLFQEGKVLLWERKHWPVVMAGGKIVWVRQFGGSGSTITEAERSRGSSVSDRFQLVYRQD